MRQCSLCGRKGSRAFVHVDGRQPRKSELSGLVCSGRKACRRRRARLFPSRDAFLTSPQVEELVERVEPLTLLEGP